MSILNIHKKEIKKLIDGGKHPKDFCKDFDVHDTTMAAFCKDNNMKYKSKNVGRYQGKMVGGKVVVRHKKKLEREEPEEW